MQVPGCLRLFPGGSAVSGGSWWFRCSVEIWAFLGAVTLSYYPCCWGYHLDSSAEAGCPCAGCNLAWQFDSYPWKLLEVTGQKVDIQSILSKCRNFRIRFFLDQFLLLVLLLLLSALSVRFLPFSVVRFHSWPNLNFPGDHGGTAAGASGSRTGSGCLLCEHRRFLSGENFCELQDSSETISREIQRFTRPGQLTVCELENGHRNSEFSH